MQVYTLFPTVITTELYEEKDSFKEIFYQNIFKYMTNGISNENTKNVNLHHEPKFNNFFRFVTQATEQHLETLAITKDTFVLNIVKSWCNITKEYATPIHNHEDAHISFSYYINMPKDCDIALRFHQTQNRNDPYPNMLRLNCEDNWNMYNTYTTTILPTEGQLFVFPSKLPHDTVGQNLKLGGGSVFENPVNNIDDLQSYRICLAGDILLTFMERSEKPMGLQPKHEWRVFK